MTDKASEIRDRLTPKHLMADMPENAEELKKTIEREVDSEKEMEKAQEEARMQKQYAFSIKWKDGTGHVWKGDFVNKILSIRERQMAGVMRARLGNALPAESLDPLTQELNLIISHLAFSLTEKPDWAEDLQAIEHVALLQLIYMEVMAHEATFFGRDEIIGES